MNSNSPRLVTALAITSLISATVGLVCLRLILMLDFIDPQTGFYIVASFSAAVFPYLYAAFIVGLLVFAVRHSKLTAKAPEVLRIAAPAAITLGIAIVIPQVVPAITLVQELKNSILHPVDLLFDVLSLLTCLGSGIVFVLFALGLLANKAQPFFTHTIALALPTLWRCFLLVDRFMSKPTPTAVSDSMLSTLLDVFAVTFMVAHARVVTGLGVGSGTRLLLFSGCAYVLTTVLLFLPWLAALIWGSTPLNPALAMRWVPDAALAIYSAVCVIALDRKSSGETA